MIETLALALGLLLPPAPPADAILQPLKITAPEGLARRPRFSPDGRLIVFAGGPEGQGDIWRVGPDGEGLLRLTDQPGDDRDPTFTRDGKSVIWASDRAGSYDLYRMGLDGTGVQRLTDLPGDELEPAVSPLRYRLFAVSADGCSRSGAGGQRVSLYEKVAFARVAGGRAEVWFTSLKGRHRARMSPAGRSCRHPVWSGDGLSLLWTCSNAKGTVVHDTRATWDPTFAAALAAVGYGVPGGPDGSSPRTCEDIDPKRWRSDPCLKKLPKRYSRHEAHPVSSPGEKLWASAYSANQILLLAGRGEHGAQGVYQRLRTRHASWKPFPGLEGAKDLVWSPDGTRVVASAPDGSGRALFLSRSSYYLQQVRNLHDYPELWAKGPSGRLQINRFVARPGREKDFFQLYEKLRYRRRAAFLTADSALQVLHDEFASLLKDAERKAQRKLGLLSRALMEHYAARLATGGGPRDRYLAVVFAVSRVILDAASTVQVPEIDFGDSAPDAEPPEEGKAPLGDPVSQIQAAVPRMLQKVPASIREEVAEHLRQILSHEGVLEIRLPGSSAPLYLDHTQFQVRGHYRSSDLAGYFLAMSWLGLMPLPLDKTAFDLVAFMEHTPAAERGSGTLWDLWAQVDRMVGAFMGKTVEPSPAHLRELRARYPAFVDPGYRRNDVRRALARMVGPTLIRTPTEALTNARGPVHFSLFPRREGLDATFFAALTHPAVVGRGWPRAEDVFAALGAPRATIHALAAEKGSSWYGRYAANLKKLSRRYAGGRGLPATDIYHVWLSTLRTLAGPGGPGARTRLPFVRTPAWQDRRLLSALAGFAQLKHDAVLYAAQDYAVECDSSAPVVVFTEQPELPPVRGFVDPLPTFFGRLARLADRIYRALSPVVPGAKAATATGEGAPGHAPPPAYSEPGVLPAWADESARAWNAKRFAERLAKIADREIKGRKISRDDYLWIQHAGALMEDLLIRQQKTPDMAFGGDEGRMERGVALVTDIFTNLAKAEVLQIGVGRILDLYVAVPDPLGQRMTQGGLFSFHAFRHPMDDRLTDEAWNERLKAGKAPPLPPWTRSFVEPRPR